MTRDTRGGKVNMKSTSKLISKSIQMAFKKGESSISFLPTLLTTEHRYKKSLTSHISSLISIISDLQINNRSFVTYEYLESNIVNLISAFSRNR